MTLIELDNLVKIRQLKKEPFEKNEFLGLVTSGVTRLKDANITTLSPESRFDLAYNAAHSLSLAALRYHGYRANNRYIVFQALPHTLGLTPDIWRVLSKAHDCRNLAEYEGHLDVDEVLLSDLLAVTAILENHLAELTNQLKH